jgi:hypothetical protein
MFSPNFEVACEIISKATYPEDIFVQGGDTAKVVFRKLRKVCHEDFAPADKKEYANEVFQKLQNAWSLTEELIADNLFGKKTKIIQSFSATQVSDTNTFFVKSKKSTYKDLMLHSEGKVCNVYFGLDTGGKKVVVKVSASPSCNVFLENESLHIKEMTNLFPMYPKEGRFFPVILDSFFVDISGDRLVVNVFEYLEGYMPLSDILKRFTHAGKMIDVKHIVWIYNRILESLSASGICDIVHGGVHPLNMLLHPERHRIVLTGWTSSVKDEQKIMYACSDYTSLYPLEVTGDKDKRKAYLSTDLYMAAATVWMLLGGDVVKKTLPKSIPNEIKHFLNARLILDSQLRDDVAIHQRDRFGLVLKSVFGPPKYHNFVLPN